MAAGSRRKGREMAMQMLYQSDLGKQTPEQVQKVFWSSREEKELDEESRGFAEDLFRVATERQEQIDSLIEKHSERWKIERMAAVDRNLLRMAVGELLAYKATPAPIVINEALEIGRKFSAPESINFLNGVLDAISKDVLEQRLA